MDFLEPSDAQGLLPDDAGRAELCVPVVLVVEDNEVIRELVAYTLQTAGFDVVEARDAAEALAVLEGPGSSVSALFSDVYMPGSLDGLALASHARRRWPHLGIVVASGRTRLAETDLPERCYFLQKPYTVDEMVMCVRKAMGT